VEAGVADTECGNVKEKMGPLYAGGKTKDSKSGYCKQRKLLLGLILARESREVRRFERVSNGSDVVQK
jgi:hypothetical protein